MPLALNEEQVELAQMVTKFVTRHAARDRTRTEFEALGAGGRPSHWDALVEQGLHAIHLPAEAGGQGGSLAELAVVVDEAGYGLLPGPFLPTVIASAVAATAHNADAFVEQFVDGATAALVLPCGVTAQTAGSGWKLNGTTGPILGAGSADMLIVGADSGDGTVWVRVEASRAGVTVTTQRGTDLTRDVAVVAFEDVEVPVTEVFTGVSAVTAAAVNIAFLSVEAAGISRWFIETVTEYVKVREQFGKTIGSFQAVQHRAGRLLVAAETATASAWDAVRALDESGGEPQQRVASSAAGVVALGCVVDSAVEALALLGGIGFTWEHDLHLFWRRAMSIAAVAGTKASLARSAGEAYLDAPRDFSVAVGDAESEFRAEIAMVLERAAGLEDVEGEGGYFKQLGARRSLLAESGLVSPHLRKPYGLDATPVQQLIIQEEYQRTGLQRPQLGISEWILPTIIAAGTDAQREKFAMPTLRGEFDWCQLFSEPGAGSDAAAVATKAVKVDGGWRVAGQKVWTSVAHIANWGAALVRTDPDVPKHKGLSYLIIDMHAEGVEVRPLVQATGDAHFNEVFFDDVFVPDEHLVGAPGAGWKVALATLANERSAIAGFVDTGNESRIRDLIANAQYAGTRDDAVAALGTIAAAGAAISAMNLRTTLVQLSGGQPGPATSIAKLASAQLRRDAASAALALVGPAGAVDDQQNDVVRAELDIPTWILGGGTSEVQLNVIAQFILGLPRTH